MDLRWGLLVAGMLVSLPYCAQVRAQSMERPALNAGDSWTYEFHEGGTAASPGNFHYIDVITVSAVFAKQYEISRRSTAERDGESKQITYRITRDLNGYTRQNAALPWQEAVWLVWPLEPGHKWKFEVPIPAGIQVWEAHVEDWEEVEVPAGKFRTIRIVHDLIVAPNPLVGWKVTQWYAPAVKAFVKKTEHGWYEASITIKRDLRELKTFQLQ